MPSMRRPPMALLTLCLTSSSILSVGRVWPPMLPTSALIADRVSFISFLLCLPAAKPAGRHKNGPLSAALYLRRLTDSERFSQALCERFLSIAFANRRPEPENGQGDRRNLRQLQRSIKSFAAAEFFFLAGLFF